jgi:predicted AlkP superfamily pyrophosphatase or phosphodiesterase
LLDGFGKNLLDAAPEETEFLRNNLVGTINSVFPATTAAALSSLGSGTFPGSHGLVGWTVPIEKGDSIRMVNPLTLGSEEDLEKLGETGDEIFRFESVFNKIANGNGADRLGNFGEYGATPFTKRMVGDNFEKVDCKSVDLEDAVTALPEFWRDCERDGKSSFSYVYSNNPDTIEHKYGALQKSGKGKGKVKARVLEIIKKLNNQLKELWDTSEDVAGREIIVLADHGLVNG